MYHHDMKPDPVSKQRLILTYETLVHVNCRVSDTVQASTDRRFTGE